MVKKEKIKPVATPANETAAVKTLELSNDSLMLLYTLLNVPLHGPQLRARNRFARLVRDRLEFLDDNRVKAAEGYADKDKEGKPKFKIDADGKPTEEYELSPKNLKKFDEEMTAFRKEKWVIDLLPSIKPDLVLVRPIVLETKIDLGTVDGYVYEEIASAFEAM